MGGLLTKSSKKDTGTNTERRRVNVIENPVLNKRVAQPPLQQQGVDVVTDLSDLEIGKKSSNSKLVQTETVSASPGKCLTPVAEDNSDTVAGKTGKEQQTEEQDEATLDGTEQEKHDDSDMMEEQYETVEETDVPQVDGEQEEEAVAVEEQQEEQIIVPPIVLERKREFDEHQAATVLQNSARKRLRVDTGV